MRTRSQVSPMLESTFTDRNRSLSAFDASSPSAEPKGRKLKRLLDERTIERDEVLA